MEMRFFEGNWFRKIFIAALIAFPMFTCSSAIAQTVVWTNGGYVSGFATSMNRLFLGIPYAAPPVGQLRWKPPQPAASWAPAIRQAISFGAVCPQVSGTTVVSTNEDCLNLNVVAPLTGKQLPVMVFIHGGGFTTGANSFYDQSLLSYQGNAVVVTINYRLGVFGFLAHPALTAEAADQASGQYGIQDQQLALKWVKDNIANFGGNPNNVTIFGESAGGVSVCTQIASAKAAGLFQKAIVESGLCSGATKPLAEAETAGTTFANAIGCSTAACLRNQPTLTLLLNPPTEATLIGPGWNPTYGGVNSAVPVVPKTAIAAGNFNRVPVIVGSTHDEWRLFTAIKEVGQGYPLTLQQYSDAVVERVGSATAPTALSLYPIANYFAANAAHATMLGDSTFICGARDADKIFSRYVTTYAYEFNDPNAPPLLKDPFMNMLASHASELNYVFLTLNTSLNAVQQGLAYQMMRYWTNFAATGNPNDYLSVPVWVPYSPTNEVFQRFMPGYVGPIYDFATDHKCTFWDAQNLY